MSLLIKKVEELENRNEELEQENKELKEVLTNIKEHLEMNESKANILDLDQRLDDLAVWELKAVVELLDLKPTQIEEILFNENK